MGDYVRAKAVARLLAVSVKKVYKMVKAGELGAVKIGRAVCILASSLDEYIAAHRVVLAEADPTPVTRPLTPQATAFLFLPRRP